MKKLSKKILSVMLSVLFAFTVLPVGAVSANAATVDEARAAFTEKIEKMRTTSGSNRVVYTNITPAYEAYINTFADGAGEAEANALQTAVDNMKEFSSPAANASVNVNGSASGTYSNVLWLENLTGLTYDNMKKGSVSSSSGLSYYSNNFYLYQPSGVLLYDGKTAAKLPVLFAIRQTNGEWNLRFDYVTETGGRLSTDWLGTSVAGNDGSDLTEKAVFPSNTSYYIPKELRAADTDSGYDYYDANISTASGGLGGDGYNTGFYNFKNSLAFTPKDTDTARIYSSFDWSVFTCWYNMWDGNEHKADGTKTLNTNHKVYVLNYKKLLDQIETTLDKYDDNASILDTSASAFSAGNAQTLFKALDAATSLDLTDSSKYAYGDTADNEKIFNTARDDLNSAIEGLKNSGGSAGDAQSLKAYIEKYEKNMSENPFRSDLEKTYKLYLQAKECYDAYQYGYGGKEYTGDDEEQKTNYENLVKKMASVAKDFSNAVDNQTTFAKVTTAADGTKTYSADVNYTGDYTPDYDASDTSSNGNKSAKGSKSTKYFSDDTISGDKAYQFYNVGQDEYSSHDGDGKAETRTFGANAVNILYFPQVKRTNTVSTTAIDSANNVGVFKGDNVTQVNTDQDYTGNLRHAVHTRIQMCYPQNIVLLYNGKSNPRFPMMMRLTNTQGSGDSSYLNFLYPTSGDAHQIQYFGTERNLSSAKGTDRFNTEKNSNKVSSNWQIRTNQVVNKFDSHYYASDSGWQGMSTGKGSDKIEATLDFKTVFSQASSTTGTWRNSDEGSAAGFPERSTNGNSRIPAPSGANGTFIASAGSSLEYKDSYFNNYTSDENTSNEALFKNYPSINWYAGFHESTAYTKMWFSDVFTVQSSIDVINTQPVENAVNDFFKNQDTNTIAQILQNVYLYDKQAVNYANLLSTIDKIGNFNPNNYDYSKTTGGTLASSDGTNKTANQGVQECVEAMQNLIKAVGDVKTEAEKVTPEDPSNKPSESTSETERNNNLWYDGLRNELLKQIEQNGCSEGSKWEAYQKVLNEARAALTKLAVGNNTAATTSNINDYYPTDLSQEDIDTLTNNLKTAREEYIKSGQGEHTYEYVEENDEGISTWNCEYDSEHPSVTFDMSAYNDLDIAYSTMDPEAFVDKDGNNAFYDLVGKYYGTNDGLKAGADETAKDAEAYKGGSAVKVDYTNVRFVQVKPHSGFDSSVVQPTAKNINQLSNEQVVQDYVDAATANLLEKINDAQKDKVEIENSDGTKKEVKANLRKYKVIFNVVTEGENDTGNANKKTVSIDGKTVSIYGQIVNGTTDSSGNWTGDTFVYGEVPSFYAGDSPVYNMNNAKAYKWAITTINASGKEQTREFEYRDETFSSIIQKDCIITAYAKPQEKGGQKVVSIQGPTGELKEKYNAADTDAVEIKSTADGIVVTIGSKSYTIEPTTSYSLTDKIKINNKDVTINNDGITFASVKDLLEAYPGNAVAIRAVGQMIPNSKYTINAKGEGGNIRLDKVKTGTGVSTNVDSGTSASVDYDTKVKVVYSTKTKTFKDGEGTLYGIAVNENQLTGKTGTRYIAIAYNNKTQNVPETDSQGNAVYRDADGNITTAESGTQKTVTTNSLDDSVQYYFRANKDVTFYPIYRITGTAGSYKYVVDDESAQSVTAGDGSETTVSTGSTITDATDRYYLNRHLPFVISYIDTSNIGAKHVYRNAYTANLPSYVDVTEHGIVYERFVGTDNNGGNDASKWEGIVRAFSFDENDLTVENALANPTKTTRYPLDSSGNATTDTKEYNALLVKQAASKPADNESHQYSFSLKNKDYDYMLARGYIKFTYTFSTVDENQKTVEAPIQAVGYGDSGEYLYTVSAE